MVLADAVDRDRLVATFLELVAIDSPTGHKARIGRELTTRFGELGCQVAKTRSAISLAVLPGAYADTVLAATHMDTVGSDTGIQPIMLTGLSGRTDRRFLALTTSLESLDASRS